MFRWLKNRRFTEQKKLCWQNMFAAEPDGFLRLHHSEDCGTLSTMCAIRNRAEDALSQLSNQVLLHSNVVDQLLDDNLELRRLHDEVPKNFRLPFDQFYKPPNGWSELLSR